MNKEVKKETNLEHYKEELKGIFSTDFYRPLVMAYKIKDRLDKNFEREAGNTQFTDDILDWMAQPYEAPILDSVEKRYLGEVIKPFRNRIRFIVKLRCRLLKEEFIYISVEGDSMTFPPFKLGTKYKGMKANIEYSLEELGL